MKEKILKILQYTNLLWVADYLVRVRLFGLRKHFPYLNVIAKTSRVTQRNVSNIDANLFDRIFCSAKSELDYEANGQWMNIHHKYQADAVELIRNGDKIGLQQMLANPLSNNVQYGFDNLASVLQSNFRLETRNEVATAADHFLALGEFSLTTRYFSPEDINSPIKKKIEISNIIRDIVDSKFGDGVVFPNPFLNEVGVDTEFGVASIRVPSAIYQALRVREFGTSICEIGPGLGRTAYFARLGGVKKYTLVDLPIPSLCQAWFLGSSVPDEKFTFNHEIQSDEGGFIFRQPDKFMAETDQYDLILNVDSLTEMNIDVARAYLRNFVGKTAWFLSINHEGNEFSVRDIAAEIPQYKLISRNRAWIRQGYVEELYEIEQ